MSVQRCCCSDLIRSSFMAAHTHTETADYSTAHHLPFPSLVGHSAFSAERLAFPSLNWLRGLRGNEEKDDDDFWSASEPQRQERSQAANENPADPFAPVKQAESASACLASLFTGRRSMHQF